MGNKKKRVANSKKNKDKQKTSDASETTRNHDANTLIPLPPSKRLHESPDLQHEILTTIQQPALEIHQKQLSKRDAGRQSPLTIADYISYAEKGHAPFAYLAGLHFKSSNQIPSASNKKSATSTLSIAESNQKAFHYFKQAATANIGVAMQALAICYEKGIGVPKSLSTCRDWLWKAVLKGSTGALDTFNSKILVERDHCSSLDMLEKATNRSRLRLSGPNLGSLFLVLGPKLQEQDPKFTLPPFRNVQHRVKTAAADTLQKVLLTIQVYQQQHGIEFETAYARRGVAQHHHQMSTTSSSNTTARADSSLVLVVPPSPQYFRDTIPDKDALDDFGKVQTDINFPAICRHSEDQMVQSIPSCIDCLNEARDRLEAAACGRAAISLKEIGKSQGRLAVWEDSNGHRQSETFKNYCRGEAECALASIAACCPGLAHPLFVAQDPNLFWPLIQAYGSVRDALAYVAPHLAQEQHFDESKKKRPTVSISNTETSALVEDAVPGTMLQLCSNSSCLKLQLNVPLGEGSFQSCAGCKRRCYCSYECHKADWAFHLRECKAWATGDSPAGLLSHQNHENENNDPLSKEIRAGECILLRGLKSKTELNGSLCTIVERMNNEGRYPTKLISNHHNEVMAIKPQNIVRLGICPISKPVTLVKCLEHGLEKCNDCGLDFKVLNHSSKLCFSRGTKLTKNQLLDLCHRYSSNIPGPGTNSDTFKATAGCQEPEKDENGYILKCLLEQTQKNIEARSLTVLAVIAGLSTYCAQGVEYASHVENLLSTMYPDP